MRCGHRQPHRTSAERKQASAYTCRSLRSTLESLIFARDTLACSRQGPGTKAVTVVSWKLLFDSCPRHHLTTSIRSQWFLLPFSLINITQAWGGSLTGCFVWQCYRIPSFPPVSSYGILKYHQELWGEHEPLSNVMTTCHFRRVYALFATILGLFVWLKHAGATTVIATSQSSADQNNTRTNSALVHQAQAPKGIWNKQILLQDKWQLGRARKRDGPKYAAVIWS